MFLPFVFSYSVVCVFVLLLMFILLVHFYNLCTHIFYFYINLFYILYSWLALKFGASDYLVVGATNRDMEPLACMCIPLGRYGYLLCKVCSNSWMVRFLFIFFYWIVVYIHFFTEFFLILILYQERHLHGEGLHHISAISRR